jgi:nucleoside-diphosphate-sugar epimerase
MEARRTILITGAAGNLGSRLARHLVPAGHELRLMYHRTPLPEDLMDAANVHPIKADLAVPATLPAAVAGADVIVHFAGRLFAPRAETFLPETNTRWFSNLLPAGLAAKVGRIFDVVSARRGSHFSGAPGDGPARSQSNLSPCPHAA